MSLGQAPRATTGIHDDSWSLEMPISDDYLIQRVWLGRLGLPTLLPDGQGLLLHVLGRDEKHSERKQS